MKPSTQTEEESNGWEGTVTTIKKVINNSNQVVKQSTQRQIDQVIAQVQATSTKVTNLDKRCDDLNNIATKQLTQSEKQMEMMASIQSRLDQLLNPGQ